MRDFLDSILSHIGSESLTDEEFDALPEDLTELEYNAASYDALKTVLEGREGVSGQLKRLKSFFIAKGYDPDATANDAVSEIFLGAALD